MAKLVDFIQWSPQGGYAGGVRDGVMSPEVQANPNRASVLSDVYMGQTALFILCDGVDPKQRLMPGDRWPSLLREEIRLRSARSTEVVKVVLAAASRDPRQRPASLRVHRRSSQQAIDEENLARRFKWQGRLVSQRHCELHDAIDLASGAGYERGGADHGVLGGGDGAGGGCRAAGLDGRCGSMNLHHESIPVIRAVGGWARGGVGWRRRVMRRGRGEIRATPPRAISTARRWGSCWSGG
ncbi:MAG: hypothetical protein R3F65_09455 [bacterium]